MAVEGLLYIEVAGRTITRAAGPNIKRIIDQQVRMIDPDVVLKESSFGGFMLKLEWSGIPKDIGKAQSLFSYLRRVLKDYFEAWRFKVNINLIESEE